MSKDTSLIRHQKLEVYNLLHAFHEDNVWTRQLNTVNTVTCFYLDCKHERSAQCEYERRLMARDADISVKEIILSTFPKRYHFIYFSE